MQLTGDRSTRIRFMPGVLAIQIWLRHEFEAGLHVASETESHLRNALLRTLHHPGRMVRAQMVYAVGTYYGLAADTAKDLAIAVEYFHTASLIIDDLPCMDDASSRRSEPCVHCVHGEATAILAALGLVNRAYALAWQVINSAPAQLRQNAADYLENRLGVAGVLNGQSQDLNYATLPKRFRVPHKVALGKTVSLIQLSLVLPALLGGATATEQRLLERLATFWGLSYQIIDDLKDMSSRPEQIGKTAARDELLQRPNAALSAGSGAALRRLERMLRLGDCTLSRLFEHQPQLLFLRQMREHFAAELAGFQGCQPA
jgi:geranylgeranyl pyrophosphate synthase